jgi:hypothetical protein
MRKIAGNCLCGKTSYSANTEPIFVAVCHCKNCQKQTGTAFSIIVGVQKADLHLSGPTKTFRDKGDSGKAVFRNFCGECGSPVTTEAESSPGLVFIKAGTLNDTSWLDPKIHIYCESAQPWTAFPESSQKFAKRAG